MKSRLIYIAFLAFFFFSVVSPIFHDSFLIGVWVLRIFCFLLITQNMGRVVKSREVYTPSLNFA